MGATVSGSKVVTKNVSPQHTAMGLTSILATPVERLTIAELRYLTDALARVSGAGEPWATVGSLLQ